MAKPTRFEDVSFNFGANVRPKAAAFRVGAGHVPWRGDRIRGGATEWFRKGAGKASAGGSRKGGGS
jgi:ribosomal protein L4